MAGKDEIRRELLAERRRRWSAGLGDHAAVCSRLMQVPGWQEACAVAGYMALPGEVDLTALLGALLAAGRPVWLPRYDADRDRYEMVSVGSLEADLAPGAFGIREPVPALSGVSLDASRSERVLWLVPGVAFDLAGHRLGRGRGYYDRLLRGAGGLRVGVAWDWQLLDRVPHTDRDEPMHWIVTDIRTIACGGPAAGQAR